MTKRPALLVLALAFWAACEDSGLERVLTIRAVGEAQGAIYLDVNGSGTQNAGDLPLTGVKLKLLAKGTRDTVAQVTSTAQGTYRVTSLPPGTYRVLIDTTPFSDTVRIMKLDPAEFTVMPDSTAAFSVQVSYPKASVAQVRAAPVGRKVFVEGLALNGLTTFGDSTVHIVDTTGVIRATRVRQALAAGDSVRFLGRRSMRDGQPTIDDVTPVPLTSGGVPSQPERVTNAVAQGADNGRLDAALVKVVGVKITDTVTTVPDLDFRLTTSDVSGPLEVLLDVDAGLSLTRLHPDTVLTIDVTGLLIPTGAGTWRLKPRFNSDVVRR